MDSQKAPSRLRGLPTWLINQASLTAHQVVAARLSAASAHRYHFSVLATLAESGPVSQAELGRRCGLDRSDITAVLAELAEAGWVDREPDPADRRRNTVRVTAAGRRRLQALDRLVAKAQEELLAPLDAEERDALVRLLTRVVDHHAPGRRPA